MTSQEAVVPTPTADDDSSNQGSSSWDSEKWMDCGYILMATGIPWCTGYGG